MSVLAEHKAIFYSKDAELADSVVAHISSAFESGIPTVLILTNRHRQNVDAAIQRADFDPDLLRDVDLLRTADAQETLESFYRAGAFDESRFKEAITDQMKGAACYAYGEMVGILSEQGRYDDAIELEEMWNRLGREHTFSLLCGYSTKVIGKKSPQDFLSSVCRVHEHVQSPVNNSREVKMILQTARIHAGYDCYTENAAAMLSTPSP